MDKLISHRGTVIKIEENIIFVKIETTSACAGCHAKGVCGQSDKEDKIIECSNNPHTKVGDIVNIAVSKELGFQAVALGYFCPFLVLMITLVTLITLGNSEELSGLLALVATGLYYLVLYLFKDRISSKFTFKIL